MRPGQWRLWDPFKTVVTSPQSATRVGGCLAVGALLLMVTLCTLSLYTFFQTPPLEESMTMPLPSEDEALKQALRVDFRCSCFMGCVLVQVSRERVDTRVGDVLDFSELPLCATAWEPRECMRVLQAEERVALQLSPDFTFSVTSLGTSSLKLAWCAQLGMTSLWCRKFNNCPLRGDDYLHPTAVFCRAEEVNSGNCATWEPLDSDIPLDLQSVPLDPPPRDFFSVRNFSSVPGLIEGDGSCGIVSWQWELLGQHPSCPEIPALLLRAVFNGTVGFLSIPSLRPSQGVSGQTTERDVQGLVVTSRRELEGAVQEFMLKVRRTMSGHLVQPSLGTVSSDSVTYELQGTGRSPWRPKRLFVMLPSEREDLSGKTYFQMIFRTPLFTLHPEMVDVVVYPHADWLSEAGQIGGLMVGLWYGASLLTFLWRKISNGCRYGSTVDGDALSAGPQQR